MFRHGDRTPTDDYPNNPIDAEDWPNGMGQVTQVSAENKCRKQVQKTCAENMCRKHVQKASAENKCKKQVVKTISLTDTAITWPITHLRKTVMSIINSHFIGDLGDFY